MEKHCSTISFGLKNRKDKSGMSPITMTIGANGERAEFQTGRKIAPENWDNGKWKSRSCLPPEGKFYWPLAAKYD